jgi:hypothetical protein
MLLMLLQDVSVCVCDVLIQHANGKKSFYLCFCFVFVFICCCCLCVFVFSFFIYIFFCIFIVVVADVFPVFLSIISTCKR